MQSLEKNNFELSSVKVGIVLPSFNEHENIFELLRQIESIFSNKFIIIVDDSTNDNIKNRISSKADLQYVKTKSRLGRGSSVLYGLEVLLKDKEIDLFVEMDTDLCSHPNELPSNIRYFLDNKLDLLASSRYLKDSKIINWPLRRRLFSLLANKLAKFLLKVPVSDYTMGFRIYSRKAVNHIVRNCGKFSGFILLLEILIELYTNNFKISDIKTTFKNREKGKSSVNFKLVLESFFGLIKLYINKRAEINLIHKKKVH